MNTWQKIRHALDNLEQFGHYDFEITNCIDSISCGLTEIEEESELNEKILDRFCKELGHTEYDKVVQKVLEEL